MSLPTSTTEALALIEESFRSEHEIWKHEIHLDAVSIDEARIRETAHVWWVPLGANTKWQPDYRGDESFIVVTRDGSSNGLYLTGKPLWWDDPAPRPSLAARLSRLIRRQG